MSGYLGRLVARSLGTADLARPVIAPLFADWRREPATEVEREAVDGALEIHETQEREPTPSRAARSARPTEPLDAVAADPRPAARPLSGDRAAIPSTEPSPPSGGSAPSATLGTLAPTGAAPVGVPSVGPRRSETASPRPLAQVEPVTVPAPSVVNALDDRPAPRPARKRPARADDATAIPVHPAEVARGRSQAHHDTPDRPALLAPTAPAIPAPRVVTRHDGTAGGSRTPGSRPGPAPIPDDSERTVEITIGRIEIRAVPGAAPPVGAAATRRTATSLEAYLLARAREGRA
jgi:hypothetical protein